MKIMPRCPSCNSIWVNWNIKLQTIEKVYAHDCHACGEVVVTSRRKYGGMPYWLLSLMRKLVP